MQYFLLLLYIYYCYRCFQNFLQIYFDPIGFTDISVLFWLTIHPVHSDQPSLSTDVKIFFCGKHRIFSYICQCVAVPLTSSYFCVSFKWLEFQVYKFLMNPNCNFWWGYLTDQLFSIHRALTFLIPPLSLWFYWNRSFTPCRPKSIPAPIELN